MLLEKIKSLAAQGQEENIAMRRYLHANPELSYQEFETCKFIQTQLTKIGIPFTVIATTGVLGIIEGKNPSKRVIALRADMDALPIIEVIETPIPHNELIFNSMEKEEIDKALSPKGISIIGSFEKVTYPILNAGLTSIRKRALSKILEISNKNLFSLLILFK